MTHPICPVPREGECPTGGGYLTYRSQPEIVTSIEERARAKNAKEAARKETRRQARAAADERHPELVPEAEEIARATVTDVDADAVAEDVAQAVLDLDTDDQVLGWAEDFPAETAGHAVATLARESDARHRRTWRLGDAILDQVPKRAAMIGRASEPASIKR